MRTTRVALLAIFLASSSAGASIPDPFVGFDAHHPPSIAIWPIGDLYLPDREFVMWCRGPDLLASLSRLSVDDFAGWLTSESPATIMIEGESIPLALYSANFSTWSGWTVMMVADAKSHWLNRMAAAGEIAISTPTDTFTFPDTEETHAKVAAFWQACDAERFGQDPTQPIQPGDPPRAVLYEPSPCERCTIYQPTSTTAGAVVWRFDEATRTIRAEIDVPDAGLSLEMTIFQEFGDGSRTFLVDMRTIAYQDRGLGFDPSDIGMIGLANDPTDRDDITIDPFTQSPPGRGITRHQITEADLALIPTRDIILLYDASDIDTLAFELGLGGHAVFNEAMAAWGITPGAN